MESSDRRRIRKRGIRLASVGFVVALGVLLAAKSLGVAAIGYDEWIVAVVVTFAAQLTLWLIPHRGWDAHVPWDPHYLYLPMATAAGLLNFYIYLVPELRVLGLMGWFVALLFMVGLANFVEVVLLSTAMTGGYLVSVGLRSTIDPELSMLFEMLLALVFWIITVYAAVVFERLRRDRVEMKDLRRRLADLATTDALTDLPNRRHFEEILRGELSRIRRYGGSCTLVMIDVDHFKAYNDARGHLAGDNVLRELSGVMRRHLRVSDMLARYGGEEFGWIMVNATKEEAYPAIERLRRIIEAHPFIDEGVMPDGRLTISAGVASCPDDGTDFEGLVGRADAALYAAKRHGRNRVWLSVA